MEMAQNIISQLGRMTLAMIGAKNLMSTGKGLQLDIGSNPMRLSRIVITLDPSDTYTMAFIKGRGLKARVAKSLDGIYVDALHETIRNNTGLYTNL